MREVSVYLSFEMQIEVIQMQIKESLLVIPSSSG